jgi:hypothetical protein
MAEKFIHDGDISPPCRNNPVITVMTEKLKGRSERSLLSAGRPVVERKPTGAQAAPRVESRVSATASAACSSTCDTVMVT